MTKKLKKIKNLGVSSLILQVIAVIILLVTVFMGVAGPVDGNNGGAVDPNSAASILTLLFILVGFVILIIALVLSITGSIMILITDFKNDEVNNNKIVWGVLSLLLIGPIGLIVFYVANKNKILTPFQTRNFDFSNENQNNNQNSRQDYSVENIKRAVEMYSAEAISKEDLDEMKKKNS